MIFTIIGALTVSVWITRAIVWLDTPMKKEKGGFSVEKC